MIPNEKRQTKKLIIDPKFQKELGKVILTRYLNQICSNTGQCIAFGIEQDKIKKVFHNYNHFKHVINTKMIGASSANGFIINLTYKVKNYQTLLIFSRFNH